MSASGTVERMRTAAGVVAVAMDYLGVSLSLEAAERYTYSVDLGCDNSWRNCRNSVSAGPVVDLKSRLLADGFFQITPPDEPDDLPIMYRIKPGCRKAMEAVIAPVARSKMFRTHLIVEPINLVSWRVAGMPW